MNLESSQINKTMCIDATVPTNSIALYSGHPGQIYINPYWCISHEDQYIYFEICVSTSPAPGGTLTKNKSFLDTAFITVIINMKPGRVKTETKNDF